MISAYLRRRQRQRHLRQQRQTIRSFRIEPLEQRVLLTGFTAYNGVEASALTDPNTTFYGDLPGRDAAGPLWDVVRGVETSVLLTTSQTGVVFDTKGSNPPAGTDGVAESGAGYGWLTVNLGIATLRGSARKGEPEFRIKGQAYGDAADLPLPDPPPPGLHLRVDAEMPWGVCHRLVQWAAAKEIRLAFALSKEDPNFFRERSTEIPIGNFTGRCALVTIELAGESGEEAKGAPVKLLIPAYATAGQVIRAAHHLRSAGATSVLFEFLR